VSDVVRYGLAFSLPFLVTFLLTPLAWRLARRIGVVDHPREYKFHREATPYLGGLAVALGVLAVTAVTAGADRQVLTILAGSLAATVLGLIDDWRGVGPLIKLVVEAGIGVALWMAGVRAGLFGIEALDLVLTVVWVVAVTNAMNLLDNMNGITAGVAAVCALGFFAIAATRGDYLVASLAAGVAGGSLGFLRYNFPRARIFLGDAGSLLLGFLLAALGLKLDLIGQSGAVRAAIAVLIVAVPLFDMMLVIAARLHDGRPISQGGTDHTAHRLVVQGLDPRLVAIIAYLVQFACCVLAYVLEEAPDPTVVIASGTLAAMALGLLAYVMQMETPTGTVVRLPEAKSPSPSRLRSSR
jgi:UDP-GlcNAc:undecaprenyl-phosphate GlcNAc-1-phosphate transferase